MAASIHVKDLTAPELRVKITPALVAAQVRMGSANKLMPSFAGGLSEEQIQAIATFVASPSFLAPRRAPP